MYPSFHERQDVVVVVVSSAVPRTVRKSHGHPELSHRVCCYKTLVLFNCTLNPSATAHCLTLKPTLPRSDISSKHSFENGRSNVRDEDRFRTRYKAGLPMKTPLYARSGSKNNVGYMPTAWYAFGGFFFVK